jgi:hypothetical protein
MARVVLRLTDSQNNQLTYTDDDQGGLDCLALSDAMSGKSVTASVTKGPNYVLGDHVRLMESDQPTGTDMICLDPAIAGGATVQLSAVDKGFADRATAINFITNTYGTPYARVRLYNEGDPDKFPSMVFYSFQQPANPSPGEKGLFGIDLDSYYFDGKTFRLLLEATAAPPEGALFVTNEKPSTVYTWVTLANPAPDLHAIGLQSAIRIIMFSRSVVPVPA